MTAQDYDSKPIQTQIHIAVSLEKWDSVTHQRSETPVTSSDAQTGADGTVARRSAHQHRQRRLRSHRQRPNAREPHRRRPEPGSGSGTAPASVTTRTPKPRSSPTKSPTRWATPPTCSWSPASKNPGPWSPPRATAVQSRQLLHATGASFAFDMPITKLAQPNLVDQRRHRPRQPVHHRAKKPQSPARRAHAHRHRHAQQDQVSARRKRQLRCAGASTRKASPSKPT